MGPRKIVWLVAVLAAAVLIAFLSRQKGEVRGEGLDKPLLTLEDVRGVDRVELRKKTLREPLVLVRGEGEAWVLPAEKNFPVDGMTLTRMFDNLTTARRERIAGTRNEDLADLGIGPDAGTLLLQGNGQTVAEVSLGEERPSGGQYVALRGKAPAWLLAKSIHAPWDVEGWLLKTLLDLPPEDVRAVESFQGPTSLFRAERGKDDAIAVAGLQAGEETESPAASAVFSALQGLRFEKKYVPGASEVSAAQPERRVKFELKDGRAIEVSISATPAPAKGEGTRIYLVQIAPTVPEGFGNAAASQAMAELRRIMADWHFTVPEYVAQKFLKERKDLVTAKK